MKIHHLLLTTAIAAISPFAGSAALAQAGTVTPAADTPAPGDIIVTAQRRSESIQKVPVSVTALSAQDLKNRGLNDLTQISLAAPSLQVNNNNNFSVRGIGTLSFSTALDTSVAISLDDVNLSKPLLSAVPFYDLAQVEVLNGPQGLLFGKNASAGLLNVRTNKPEIGHLGASFDVEATSRDRPGSDAQGILARSSVNLPVTADSALRIATIYSYQQPVTRFVGPRATHSDLDLRQYGVRAKYLWNAPGDTTLYLIGDYNRSAGVTTFFDTTFRSLGTGSPETGPLARIGITPSADNLLAAGNAPFYRDLETGGAQGTLSHSFGNGMTISNIFAWKFYKLNQQLDGDQAPGDGVDVNSNRSSYNQYSNELRLTLPDGNRLSGQMGLFYFQSEIRSDFNLYGNNFLPDFLLPQFPFCVGATLGVGGCTVDNFKFIGQDTVYTLNTKSYAAFGQLSYRLADGLRMVAGGRVTHDKISIDLINDQRPYFVPLGAPGTYDESYSNTNFSFKVGPQWEITPTIMLYGNYGQGYKGPGFNDTPVSATGSLTVRPETTHSFEAGLKSQFFNRRLTVNVSLFHTKFLNYQAQSFNIVTRSFLIQNAASLTSKGIELSVLARPFRGLTINASGTLLDSKFDEYPGAQCYPGQSTASCTIDGTFDAGGLRAPLAPKFAGTVDATYEHPLSERISGFVEANLYHRSSIYFQTNHAPGTELGAINTLGASAGLSGNGWRASLFCKNCTNKIYPVNISPVPVDSGVGIASYYQTFDFNSVRTIGLRFSFQY